MDHSSPSSSFVPLWQPCPGHGFGDFVRHIESVDHFSEVGIWLDGPRGFPRLPLLLASAELLQAQSGRHPRAHPKLAFLQVAEQTLADRFSAACGALDARADLPQHPLRTHPTWLGFEP